MAANHKEVSNVPGLVDSSSDEDEGDDSESDSESSNSSSNEGYDISDSETDSSDEDGLLSDTDSSDEEEEEDDVDDETRKIGAPQESSSSTRNKRSPTDADNANLFDTAVHNSAASHHAAHATGDKKHADKIHSLKHKEEGAGTAAESSVLQRIDDHTSGYAHAPSLKPPALKTNRPQQVNPTSAYSHAINKAMSRMGAGNNAKTAALPAVRQMKSLASKPLKEVSSTQMDSTIQSPTKQLAPLQLKGGHHGTPKGAASHTSHALAHSSASGGAHGLPAVRDPRSHSSHATASISVPTASVTRVLTKAAEAQYTAAPAANTKK